MKKIVPLLLSLLLIPTMASAQEREFDIEVLIFKRVIDAEKTNESWPNELTAISMDGVESFDNSEYRRSKGAQMLPYSSYKLIKERETLDNHAGFAVLLHKAWRQGDQGRGSAPKFHVQAGTDYSKLYTADGAKIVSANDPSALDTTQSLYELDGKIQVYVQHYLFLETALNLREPSVRTVTFTEKQPEDLAHSENFSILSEETKNDVNVQAGNMEDVSPEKVVEKYLKTYRMDQKRRMRSSETHYLDHPLMGMIIQVRRVEQ